MKKYILPALGALSLLAGCNFLTRDPLGSIAPENFFKTREDAEASLTSCYDALQNTGAYGQELMIVGEMPSDNCTTTNNDVLQLERINWNSTSSQVYNIYRQAYVGINRANIVLKYVPAVAMADTARRRQILGEAHFLRALNFFNLVRLYGGVPLRIQPSESGASNDINLARASADDVYNQVVSDLQAATVQMPATNTYRSTKNSAYALLARVQLTRRNWAAAQAAAQAVTGVSLNPSFKALFPADNKQESLFEIQYAGNADGGNILPDLLLPSPPATYSFPKFNVPTAELIAYADTANDLRWSYRGRTNAGRDHASYVDGGRGNGNDRGPFVYKWSSNPNSFNSPDNTYVLRYAEVLLTIAEASNEQTASPTATALNALNLVRSRAGLSTLTLTSSQAATKQALRNEIDRQRRLELAFEGERWYDLIRYARHTQADATAQHAVTALNIIQQQLGTANANYLVFPFPQAELNTNTLLVQNPGY